MARLRGMSMARLRGEAPRIWIRGIRRREVRDASFIQPDEAAPLHWEPECSLGQLYNNNLFYLGYVPEILHLTDALLAGQTISKGTLDDVVAIMQLYEFFQKVPEGTMACPRELEDGA